MGVKKDGGEEVELEKIKVEKNFDKLMEELQCESWSGELEEEDGQTNRRTGAGEDRVIMRIGKGWITRRRWGIIQFPEKQQWCEDYENIIG